MKKASYYELTPKTVDAEKHKIEIDTYINTFILSNSKSNLQFHRNKKAAILYMPLLEMALYKDFCLFVILQVA